MPDATLRASGVRLSLAVAFFVLVFFFALFMFLFAQPHSMEYLSEPPAGGGERRAFLRPLATAKSPRKPKREISEADISKTYAYKSKHYFGRFIHAAGRCKSIFDNAGIAAAVVERTVRGWRGVWQAKLAEVAVR